MYHILASEIDEVYHCAAEINTLKTYEQLYKVNIKGTANIVNFCIQSKHKKLHYASTLSVFVSSDQNSGNCKEEDKLKGISRLYGGYPQSKFTAELIVQQAARRYPLINIFRLGLICADKNNQGNPLDYLNLFIKSTLQSGCRPKNINGQLCVDITPLNHAVDTLFCISTQKNFGTWHIAHPQGLLLERLYSLIERQCPLEKLELNDFRHRLKNTVEGHSACLSLCRLFGADEFERYRTMDLFQATGITFDRSRSIELISDLPQTPELSDDLLLSYILKAGES